MIYYDSGERIVSYTGRDTFARKLNKQGYSGHDIKTCLVGTKENSLICPVCLNRSTSYVLGVLLRHGCVLLEFNYVSIFVIAIDS